MVKECYLVTFGKSNFGPSLLYLLPTKKILKIKRNPII